MKLFGIWSALAVGAILALALMLGRTKPWQWSYWDIAYLLPVLICTAVASWPKFTIGFRARLASGFAQALAFLTVWSQSRVALRDPVDVTVKWMSWIVIYTVTFSLVTHGIYLISGGNRCVELRCRKCKYRLVGLTESRCPECGTYFDPKLLPRLRPRQHSSHRNG